MTSAVLSIVHVRVVRHVARVVMFCVCVCVVRFVFCNDCAACCMLCACTRRVVRCVCVVLRRVLMLLLLLALLWCLCVM